MIMLDRLDALEATTASAEADQGWLPLLRWADRDGEASDVGIAWQRRAMVLARREDLAGAEDAYRRAIGAWTSIPGFEEQAADAFLSMQAAYLVNGKPDVPDADLRALACGLRGGMVAPAARADRLVAQGMSERLRGKLPDAMCAYWMAFAIQRRTGSLAGVLESAAALAELYEHAEQWSEAMLLHVVAGLGVKAAAAARAAMIQADSTHTLNLNVPRWERAAAYHVIAQHGRKLPDAYIATNADRILREARGTPDGFFAPQPATTARTALASIALAVPTALREQVYKQLRSQLHGNFINVIRASAEALILATNAGVTDAVPDLLELYIEDPFNHGVHPGVDRATSATP